MKLSVMFAVTLVLLILFYLKKGKLVIFENLFLVFLLEFLITSYCAVLYINLDLWTLTKSSELFIIFRLYEVCIVPVIWLWYFNLLKQLRTTFKRVVMAFVFVAIQTGLEQWLVFWHVIMYVNWQLWQTVTLQLGLLSVLHLALQWYRRGLRAEGIAS